MHVKDFDQYSELIAKFLAGESSLSDKEALFAWTQEDEANRQFYEEIEQVWNMTNGADAAPFDTDLDDAWAKIDRGTGPSANQLPTNLPPLPEELEPSSARIVPLSKRIQHWRVAAAILLLAVAGLWWTTQQTAAPSLVEIQTLSGEKKEISLPDGSHVWLNENSRLVYAEDFTIRNLNLEGEAFFAVERMEESPFTISSGEATTQVLGTSFNVRAYPLEENIEVTVETGKVALALAANAEAAVELPAGTSGIVIKKEERVERIEEKISNALAWKTLKLDFDDDPMEEVISTLERYFGTEIIVTDQRINACPYTSTFDQPDLDSILDIIGASVGFEVRKEGAKYFLEGGGCQLDN